jgi:hypothetical protein
MILGHLNSSFIDAASPGKREYETLVRLTDLLKIAIGRKHFEPPTNALTPAPKSPRVPHELPEETPSSASLSQLPKRRAGKKPNTELNNRIAEVLREFGPDWPNKTETVCQTLDDKDVGLPRSKKARTNGWTKWLHAFDDDPEWVRKALQYRWR